jgi:uncharacterized protein (TIGR02300 family)
LIHAGAHIMHPADATACLPARPRGCLTSRPGNGMARPLPTKKAFVSEMAKPELGTKRTCVTDGIRFYDLNKVPAVCPKCGTEQPQDQPRMRRAGGNVAEEKRPLKKAVVPGQDDAETDTDVEVADDEEAEDVLEDTSDLEDDPDPIGTDIEVEPESDEKDM